MADYTLGREEQDACALARSVASRLRIPDGVSPYETRQNDANTISTLLTIIDHLTLRLSQAGVGRPVN